MLFWFDTNDSHIFCHIHFALFILIGDLKVIEIHVYGDRLGEYDVLYSNNKGAYQRRDGGVHELTAYEIQEWTKLVKMVLLRCMVKPLSSGCLRWEII